MSTRAKIWKVTRVALYILAEIVAVFFLVFVPRFFTDIVTTSRYHFPDPNDGKTPRSYGLDFRWVEFKSPDGILLKGWYVPAQGDARGTIIYSHGHNRTRVEMLPEAAFAYGLGYNGLLFDLRHQGESGGEMTSVGYWERLDIESAAHYALEERKAARPIVLWGVSMGAAAALLAAAETPEIDAVVSDSTFLNFRDMLKHHWKLFLPLPTFPMADEVIYWSAWRGNFRPSDFDLSEAVARIGARPILFVGVEGDRRMPPAIARTLYSASTSPLKRLIVLPGQRHGEGFNLATKPYQAAVTEFLASIPRHTTPKEVTHVSSNRKSSER